MQEQILLYNVQSKKQYQGIKKAANVLGIPVTRVEKKDYLKPIGTLAGKKVLITVNKEYNGPELKDVMLVMAGLSSGRIDKLLAEMHNTEAGYIPYKAILTDTNQFWTSLMLFEELQKEHKILTT